jgi:DNA ligase-1
LTLRRFAELYARLDETRSTAAKLAAMRRYFADAPARDAAWGLWLLRGERMKRVVAPAKLAAWAGEASGIAPPLVRESIAHVGDLAEATALLLDTAGLLPSCAPDVGLADWIERLARLAGCDGAQARDTLIAYWRELPRDQCHLFNKLITGALRVGVSSGLAARALAEHAGIDPALVAHRLMGDWKPGAAAFESVTAAQSDARNPAQPYPFCLATPLDGDPRALGEPSAFLVEWKWDGIRAQLIRRGARTYVWSRGGEMLNGRFPEVERVAQRLADGTVLDGEILAWRDGVLPFAVLQRRIARLRVGQKLLEEAPVAFVAYDLLEAADADVRAWPLGERRALLEALAADGKLEASPRIVRATWDELASLRADASTPGIEGLMLKRLDSPYVGGRKRGAWWKWKVASLTVDTVLIYAQSGQGRRANLYTDYTLGVWKGGELVPVAKAYSGLRDDELVEMDRWIRAHTTEKFGPVRAVEPHHVFEIAFEGIARSTRHKSGIALRFPRIARWRRDKPFREADTIDTLERLLAAREGSR